MTAEEHNKTLATLYLIYGAVHGLTLVGLLLLVAVIGMTTSVALPMFWLITALIAFLVLFLLVGLLPVVVWHGFRRRNSRVKPVAQALAIVSLVNIPIGTALGIYTLKFFRTPGGIELYGGQKSTASEADLHDALKGAAPLMNLADRLK